MAEMPARAGPRPSAALLDGIGRALPGARLASHRLLEEQAQILRSGPGETFRREGDPIQLTLVLAGHVAFRRTTPDGRELVLGVARRGWMFGFAGIAGGPASTDLVPLTPTEVAVWPGSVIRSLAHDDPGLALDVIDGMAKYIGHVSYRLDRFIHQEARGRVLRVLAEHEDLFFGDPPVLSRSHLPALVGTSREMTGRVLRGLEHDGVLVRVGKRGLRLLAPKDLGRPPEEASESGFGA
jgi:CRP-like cAMP-binding protein